MWFVLVTYHSKPGALSWLFILHNYMDSTVSGDPNQGRYNIAIEIGDDKVLVVDQVKDNEVEEKVRSWSSEIANIQRQYGYEPQMGNYSRSKQ